MASYFCQCIGCLSALVWLFCHANGLQTDIEWKLIYPHTLIYSVPQAAYRTNLHLSSWTWTVYTPPSPSVSLGLLANFLWFCEGMHQPYCLNVYVQQVQWAGICFTASQCFDLLFSLGKKRRRNSHDSQTEVLVAQVELLQMTMGCVERSCSSPAWKNIYFQNICVRDGVRTQLDMISYWCDADL